MKAIALSRDKRKVLIAGGLGVVLLGVVVVRLVGGGGGTGDTASASSSGGILEASPTSELDADPQHLATVARIAHARSAKPYVADETRDPMRPLVGARQPAPEAEGGGEPPAAVPTSLPPICLYGVVWDPAIPIALIDGNEVRVGDTVKGARVIEIGMDRVVFTYRSRQFVLTVE